MLRLACSILLPLSGWLWGSLVAPQIGQAQWAQVDRDRLADEMEAAAENLDPDQFPTVAESLQDVRQQIQAVRDYFAEQADRENAAAWLRYLDLEPLIDAIASEESPALTASQAIDVGSRLIGTAPGLELPPLTDLRQGLIELTEAIRFRDSERTERLLRQQLLALAERVRQMDDQLSADDAATLGAAARTLQFTGQAEGLVRSLQQRLGNPNLALLIGEPLVQDVINRSVHETRPVRECILGTRLVGTAALNGMVTADLLPSLGAVRMAVALNGHVTTRNTGYNGPVRLRTVSNAQVHVHQVLAVDETGIRTNPAFAEVTLQSDIVAIEHHLRLVRRIARKQAAQQKPRADRIAVEKMRRQVGTQFVQQIEQATAVQRPGIREKVVPLLTRLSLQEPSRLWESTGDAIVLDATIRAEGQLASLGRRPPVTPPFDAAVQIHESAIDNALSPFLAGRTVREGDLAELVSSLDFLPNLSIAVQQDSGLQPSVEEQAVEAEDAAPFEIDFARLRPIIFEAREQTLRLGVRGTRFAQGDRELDRTLEITALYEPVRTPEGYVVLQRQGGVDVDFPASGGRLSVTQIGLKRTIQRKFANVFPETLLHNPIEVPTTVGVETLRGEVFRPQQIKARGGWLTVALD